MNEGASEDAHSTGTLRVIMIPVNGEHGNADVKVGIFIINCREAARLNSE